MAGLVTVVMIAAAYTVTGIGMPMSAIEMTSMVVRMPDMMMASVAWTPRYGVLVFMMWWVMMVAMMVPSAAPTILFYTTLVRKNNKVDHPFAAASVFLFGYLMVWGGFSLAATVLQWGLVSLGQVNAMMEFSQASMAAAVLVGAGLYQVSPLKQACLRHCQHPFLFFLHNWKPGLLGALRMGMQNGVVCLGCCWALMVLLFVGGVMNLLWIAALALFVGLEKLALGLPWLTKLSSAVLISGGLALVVALWGDA
ncbi:DUF2182 domain-containing protein [Marinibacterium profundimaris]|nr:DUF2182 domain-containing protein [Marinibacterium profundimaris]